MIISASSWAGSDHPANILLPTGLISYRKTKAGALFGSDAASHFPTVLSVGGVLEAKWS